MPLDDALKRALATPQSRLLVLKIETQLLQFLETQKNAALLPPTAPVAQQQSHKPASLTLDSMNSFNRLLTHRIAEYYGLDHVVVDGQAVKIFYREKRPQVMALADIDVSGVDPEGPRVGRGGSGGGYHTNVNNSGGNPGNGGAPGSAGSIGGGNGSASSSVSSLTNHMSALTLEPDQALKSALVTISARNHVLKIEQAILSLVDKPEEGKDEKTDSEKADSKDSEKTECEDSKTESKKESDSAESKDQLDKSPTPSSPNLPSHVTVEGPTPYHRLLIYKLVQYYNFTYDVDEKTHKITIYRPTVTPQLPRPMEAFLQQPREGDWPPITLRDGAVVCGLLRKSLMEPKSRMLIVRVENDILAYLSAVSGGVGPAPPVAASGEAAEASGESAESAPADFPKAIPTGPASGPDSASSAPPLILAGLNSFNRLLAHNVAVYYGLAHTTTSQEVIVIEIEPGREPRRAIPLGSIPMEELAWAGAAAAAAASSGPANGPPLRLMRRNSPRNNSPGAEDWANGQGSSGANNSPGGSGSPGPDASSTSLEEREQAYQKARERIFKDVDDDYASDETYESRGNSMNRRGGRGGGRGGRGGRGGYGGYNNRYAGGGGHMNGAGAGNNAPNQANGMMPWMMYPPPHGMPPMMPHMGHHMPPMMPQHMAPHPQHMAHGPHAHAPPHVSPHMPPMMPPPHPEAYYPYPVYGYHSPMGYSPMHSPGPDGPEERAEDKGDDPEPVQNGDAK